METMQDKFMTTVRIGPKGQIVIPKGVRELFDIQPGDALLVLADKKQGIVITKDDMLFQQFDAIVKGEDPT